MSEEISLHVICKGDLRAGRYPAEWEDPDQFMAISPHVRRMLLDNPLSTSDDDPVRVFIVVGRRVAGRLSLVMGQVLVQSEPVSVIWGSNLVVSPDFRGRGLGTKLVECWQSLHHTVAGCHANAAAMAIYRKLGWVEFTVPYYQLVCRSRKFVQGYLRWPIGAAALSPVIDAALAFRRGLSRLWSDRRVRGLRVEMAQSMSREFDPLLSRQSAPVVTHRSAAWINWLLRSAEPDERSDHRLYYVRDRPGDVVGYFMLQQARVPLLGKRFKDVRLLSLKDWGIFDESRIDTASIALLGVRESLIWGADAILIAMSGATTGRTLRRLGFGTRKDQMVIFHAIPPSPLTKKEYRQQGSWRFTPSEGDGFFV